MKLILTASRNGALDRPGFFHHLRAIHWPLVRDLPAVLREIQGYTQNHSFLPDEDGGVPTPWRRAIERDSVIEVWFEGPDALGRMDEAPDYVSSVRPDEARFNDLPNIVLLASREETTYASPAHGRIKRFDFLYRDGDCGPEQFERACRSACTALAIDPLFQALADRQVLHLPYAPEGHDADRVQAVVMTTVSSLDAMTRLAEPRFVQGFDDVADRDRSFSVLATGFPMHPQRAA